MKLAQVFSHKNGLDILESPRFEDAYEEFRDVLKGLPPFRSAEVKKTSAEHVVSPNAMNRWLVNELSIKRDWDYSPLIIDSDPENPDRRSQLRSDYRKSRIEVEVQFGNVARYAYDVYKMAISMAQGHTDVGLMIVCMKRFANITGGNIAHYERAVRELEHSKLTLMVPLAVIGIEPDSWMIDTYPSESEAPKATKAMVNAARKARGKPPVPEETGEPALSLNEVRRIALRIA